MKKVKPHCSLCLRELLPTDDVILTDFLFIIHNTCKDSNGFGEKDRGIFFEVAARNYQYFQGFVHEFNNMGLYKQK